MGKQWRRRGTRVEGEVRLGDGVAQASRLRYSGRILVGPLGQVADLACLRYFNFASASAAWRLEGSNFSAVS